MAATLPCKGTVWTHARRKTIDGEPLALTVTSITNGKVYSRDRYGRRVKTPIHLFDGLCLDIVSVPEPKAKVSAPKLSKADMKALYARAAEAGDRAARAVVPVPMHVVQRAHPLDDTSPIVKRYAPVMDGVCGHAWIIVRPGTSRFARFLKAEGLGDTSSYFGGVRIWISDYGQSYERKAAYASAFAATLEEAGITADAMSRLD